MEAFERHVREKFMVWRRNVRQRSAESFTAEKLILKLERRMRRAAFAHYINKIELERLEVKDI